MTKTNMHSTKAHSSPHESVKDLALRMVTAKGLRDQEKELIGALLIENKSRASETVTSGVAKVFVSGRNGWCLVGCGVLCLVKDYDNRSFYITLFNVQQERITWQEEVYLEMTFEFDAQRQFISFQGMGSVYGLSFVDAEESLNFYQTAYSKTQKAKKHLTPDVRPPPPRPAPLPVIDDIPVPNLLTNNYASQPYEEPKQKHLDVTEDPKYRKKNSMFGLVDKIKNMAKDKDDKPQLDASMIGAPSGFSMMCGGRMVQLEPLVEFGLISRDDISDPQKLKALMNDLQEGLGGYGLDKFVEFQCSKFQYNNEKAWKVKKKHSSEPEVLNFNNVSKAPPSSIDIKNHPQKPPVAVSPSPSYHYHSTAVSTPTRFHQPQNSATFFIDSSHGTNHRQSPVPVNNTTNRLNRPILPPPPRPDFRPLPVPRPSIDKTGSQLPPAPPLPPQPINGGVPQPPPLPPVGFKGTSSMAPELPSCPTPKPISSTPSPSIGFNPTDLLNERAKLGDRLNNNVQQKPAADSGNPFLDAIQGFDKSKLKKKSDTAAVGVEAKKVETPVPDGRESLKNEILKFRQHMQGDKGEDSDSSLKGEFEDEDW